ncbi:MAG: hypothetical protein DDT31_00636 [Syntrophomonadaceae bacterium]|nr:hypothetical protein [Bacillota bacterium]
MKVKELFIEEKYDPAFKMLDGTNPTRPYTQDEIMDAMRQLHARIERQAEHYGGDSKKTVDRKTGNVDTSNHKFFPAQIARDE